jgi:F-type H+-transporting ATPase subunit epsilon
MNLTIVTPAQPILSISGVTSIVAESLNGSFGILPNRLDCVACLVPGILIFENAEGEQQYAAIDEGVLVKTGPEVHVSVRNAVIAKELEKLKTVVHETFLIATDRQRRLSSILTKLEMSLLRALSEVRHRG